MDEIDKKFGVPEQKKFPMPDADHVRSAIRFFNYVEPRYEKELANAILKRMKEYGLTLDDFTVGEENRFSKYVPKDELTHYGILGMKWGVRRYQNEDGSLTDAGKKRYSKTGVTNKGRRYTIAEMEPGRIAKFLQNHSDRIKKEADKTIIADIKDSDDKKIGDLQLYDEGDNSLNVTWIGVKQSERGNGYASAVMKDVIEYAKENGYKQVTLEVPGNSPDARHIYEKLGFKGTDIITTPEDDYAWGGLTAMVLKLDKLEHYGVLGMKWGIRRYQNADGSLTTAGRKRYSKPTVYIDKIEIDYPEEKIYYSDSGRVSTKELRNRYGKKPFNQFCSLQLQILGLKFINEVLR